MPVCPRAPYQRNVIYSRREQYIRALSSISHMCSASSWVIQRDQLITCGLSYHFQEHTEAYQDLSSDSKEGGNLLRLQAPVFRRELWKIFRQLQARYNFCLMKYAAGDTFTATGKISGAFRREMVSG